MILSSYILGPEKWHGTVNGYTNYACRCAACTAASAAYHKQARKDRAALIAVDDPRHGTDTFYCDFGCRCDECKKAHAKRERERYARRKARQAA